MAIKTKCYRLIVGVMGISILLSLGWVHHARAEMPHLKVRLTVKPLDLSTPPATEEIMAAGQLGGELYPTHEVQDQYKAKKMNLSFAYAIQAWNKHEYKKAIELFWNHIRQYPESPWVAEAALHIGCDAQYNGRYSEAESIFRWIIDGYKKSKHLGAKMLVNKARLRLGNQLVLQNNFDEATEHFKDLKQEGLDWRDLTYASHWIQRLSRYKAYEWAMLNCGVKALAHVMRKEGKEAEARQVVEIRPGSLKGQSIKDLKSIAARYGYKLTGLHLSIEELRDIPLPAIVQLDGRNRGDRGHYWVLEEMENNILKLFDPQSGRRFEQSPKEFAIEWKGNVLVFSDKQNLPGTRLVEDEMRKIYGGCCGVPMPESDLGDPGAKDECSPPQGNGSSGGSSEGSPKWAVNMINMNLYVADTPLWYKNAIGPSINIKLSYNSQSAISRNEPFGNKWQFNYGSYLVVDTGGQVTVFMPDGRRDVFTPDGSGGYRRPYQVFNTLTKISENHFELRSPTDTIFVYNIPPGTSSLQPFLVEIRDPYGQKLNFGYNSNVQLITITDAMGRITTLTYNSDGLVTQVTDPFGRMATFQYDANRNLIKITDMGGYWSKLSYDQNSYITSIEDIAGKWLFYIEPSDGIVTSGGDLYPAPGGFLWESYRITVTNPLGGKEEYFYNGSGSYSWYVSPRDYIEYTPEVNNYIHAPKIEYVLGLISAERGEIMGVILPELRTFLYYEYDEKGNLVQFTDGNRNITSYTYNDLGRVTSVTDADWNVTTMTYAANGVDPQTLRNGLGTVVYGVNSTHDITSITDFLNNTTIFTYNNYGQMTSKTNALGIITNYIYDSNHQLQRIEKDGKVLESFTYDPIGRIKTRTDDTGLTLTYDYNNLDKVTQITYPDGKFEGFTYSSCCPHLLDSMTDRAGRVTRYTYDALKRLSETRNPEGGVTKYEYDANGNMVRLIDPNNNVTTFVYDLDNKLIHKTYADGKTQQFTYNGDGFISSFTNGRNVTVYYGYDNRNNLDDIRYSDDTPRVSYEYDNYNRLVRMDVGDDTYLFSYDANSRLTGIDGPWPNDTLTFQYDALGRRTGLLAQGGQNIIYTYDHLNRLTGIQTGANTYSYFYFNASPLVEKLTRSNGSVTNYQYDTMKRLIGVSNETSSGAIINRYVYVYNSQDFRSSEIVTNGSLPILPNESITYSYSNANELLSSTNPDKIFLYDADGNMTQGYTPEGYVFTASYDAENRLKSIEYTDGSGVLHRIEHSYRDDHMVVKTREYEDGSLIKEIRYIHDDFLVLQERDSGNNVLNEYTWGVDMGGGIGGLVQTSQGGNHYSYLYDGKGNVTALIDGLRSVVATYTYDPFGSLISKTGSLDQPFKFSTKSYHEKTGLSYYGYRFYVPAIGRWMTKDPIGEIGGINLYGFVGNNPVNKIDPLGLQVVYKSPGHESKETYRPAKETEKDVGTFGKLCRLLFGKPAEVLGGGKGEVKPKPEKPQPKKPQPKKKNPFSGPTYPKSDE